MNQSLSNRRLEAELELARLAKALGGTSDGLSAMCLCPAHDDRRPSLSIRIGTRRLLFKCFAGCDTRDVLRAIRSLDIKGADWRHDPAPFRPRKPAFDGRRAALALWREARPISGGLAARYLEARALPGPWPALRYHAKVPLGRGEEMVRRPALLSAIVDETGLCAVQRSFLDDGKAVLATDLDPPRRMLGAPGCGAVRLAWPAECLALAEGHETAMSAMRRFNMAVWATLGNERFNAIDIPAHVTTLLLLPDNDLAGQRGEQAARARYEATGRRILTRWPPTHVSDWNDLAQEEGRERGGVRLAG
ncbi:MAG: virulence-associated protein E [Sphingobium sp.]|nr:virulence-associated protein E [Sphingobium sp.]